MPQATFRGYTCLTPGDTYLCLLKRGIHQPVFLAEK